MHCIFSVLLSAYTSYPKKKISVSMDISVVGFTDISRYIGKEFDKNINKTKINYNSEMHRKLQDMIK